MPSRSALVTFSEASQARAAALESVDAELADQLAGINGLLGDLARIQDGLSDVGALTGLPGIGQAISALNRTTSDLASPLRDLRDEIDALHQQIRGDIAVMERVQEIVYEAEHPPSVSSSPSGRPTGTARAGPSRELVLFGLVVVGVMLLIGGLGWHSRRTAVMVEAGPGREVVHRPPVPDRAPVVASIPRASLHLQGGPLAGHIIPVSGDSLLIGRGATCDLRLPERAVSRRHARLRYAEGAWFIQDQDSAGGTYVNGRRVTATRLILNDIIAIGSTVVTFQL